MPTHDANAYPRKHFFFEMFTRDISLEDCILDLIDNSIDGLIRSRKIEISGSLLNGNSAGKPSDKRKLPKIEISYSSRRFEISDTCGGISRDAALNDVFNFGHGPGEVSGTLGVYGIGLKRAIFKIGSHFEMTSKTKDEGFFVSLNVKKWTEQDEKLEDWRIPLKFVKGADSEEAAGTTIKITELRPEVEMRINDGVLAQRLYSIVSQSYALFIDKYVRIVLNGRVVEPLHIPIAESTQVKPALDEYVDGDVRVRLFASLAARGPNQEWPAEPAGWYAVCNGRVVVAADKTDLTGWGTLGFVQFHDGKHRGFVGVAFFESKNLLALPWTTTKRGLYRESPVYLHARNRMTGVARPIIKFLDSIYKADAPEDARGREIANQVRQIPLSEIAAKPPSGFKVTIVSGKRPKTTTRIQYDAERSDIERIRKHIKKPSWAANRVGKHTFDHFLKTETPR